MKKIIIIITIFFLSFVLASCAISFKPNSPSDKQVKFEIDLQGGSWLDKEAILKDKFKEDKDNNLFYKELDQDSDDNLVSIGLPNYLRDKELAYLEKDNQKYYLNYFTDNLETKTPFDLYERNKNNNNSIEPKQISKDLKIYAIYNTYPGPSRIKNKNLYYGLDSETPSLGNVKFLVIPIVFDDNTNHSDFINNLATEINNAKAFFKLSSNNLFNPEFVIPANPFVAKDFKNFDNKPFTKELLTEQLNETTSDGVGLNELELLKTIIDKNKSEFNLDESFDLDNNKLIDGILFVYDIPSETHTKNSLGQIISYTPFISYPKKSLDKLKITDNLYFNTYGWLSGNSKDTSDVANFLKHNEFIRQIGFMMGLDYYTYRSENKEVRPLLPALDPMTYGGFLDFNPVSKLLLGWLDYDEQELTDNNEFLIGDKPVLLHKKSGAIKSYFDEYYLLAKYDHTLPINNFFNNIKNSLTNPITHATYPGFSKSGYLLYRVNFKLNTPTTALQAKNIIQAAYKYSIIDNKNVSYNYLVRLIDKNNENKLFTNPTTFNYNELLYDNTNSLVNNLDFEGEKYRLSFNNSHCHVEKR